MLIDTESVHEPCTCHFDSMYMYLCLHVCIFNQLICRNMHTCANIKISEIHISKGILFLALGVAFMVEISNLSEEGAEPQCVASR